jgi:hypothetical protein
MFIHLEIKSSTDKKKLNKKHLSLQDAWWSIGNNL